MTVTMLIILEMDIVLIKITMKPATMMVETAVYLLEIQTFVHYVSVMNIVMHH